MTEVCFVLAPGQNHFFVEVAEAMQTELEQLGVATSLSHSGFPPLRDGLVYVLAPPHEFAGLAPPEHWPTKRQLERTLLYCFEQPGTKFFEGDVRMSQAGVGAVLDVNPLGVEEFRRNGVTAYHAPLGWTKAWTCADPLAGGSKRDIDLLHLGGYSPRRGETLLSSAEQLARWRTALVLGDDSAPNSVAQENFIIGDEKWELLRRSRVLLNIHAGERPYFEWLRVVQAICNGIFVVSEHSIGTEPLRVGRDFASGTPDELVALAEPYLEDEALRAAAARDALEYLEEQLPFSASAELLADLATDVSRRAPTAAAADERVTWPDNSGIRREVADATTAAELRNAFPWRRDVERRRPTRPPQRRIAPSGDEYPEFDWWKGWEDLDQIQSPAAVFARPVGLGSLGRGSYFTEPYTIHSPQSAHIGNGVKCNERADIGAAELRIGDGCMIGSDFYVRCSHPVEIGMRVGISARVAIGDLVSELHPELTEAEDGDLTVRIRDGAILGLGAIVLPGVTIGERAAVGAGSVVTRDVPPRAVAFGNPARIVGRWDGDTGQWIPGPGAPARAARTR